MRSFAAFDIDGTLIRWQLYHALVDGLIKRGYGKQSVATQVKGSRMNWKTRSHAEAFKAYERDLIEQYDKILTSLSLRQFHKVVDAVFEEYKDQVYVYTRDLIKDLKDKGYLLFAISGSQVEIVKKIAHYYGFDDYSGSVYIQKDGKFSGKVTLNLNKDKVLRELIKKHNATRKGSLAIGDSIGDSKMMEIVEQPIAFNPEAKLFAHAKIKGWKVVVERKNVIYKLESKNGKYLLAETIPR